MPPLRSSFMLLLAAVLPSSFVLADQVGWVTPLTECDCKRPFRDLDCGDDEDTSIRKYCLCMLRDFRTFECSRQFCCTNRRKLAELGQDAEPFWINGNDHERDEDYKMILEKCGNHDYEGHIYVDSHLYAYATPGPEATAAGCPLVVTHVNFETDDTTSVRGPIANKQLIISPNVDQGLYKFKDGKDGSHPIGTFKLSQLADAYEKANPSGVSSSTSEYGDSYYDAVSNNCGHYMLHLGSALGVKINADLVQFVGRRLLQSSGKALGQKIRDSAHYFSLFPRMLAADDQADHQAAAPESDEKLIAKLVGAQAAGLM